MGLACREVRGGIVLIDDWLGRAQLAHSVPTRGGGGGGAGEHEKLESEAVSTLLCFS